MTAVVPSSGADEDFDARVIDERWQQVWRDERSWEVSNTAPAERSARRRRCCSRSRLDEVQQAVRTGSVKRVIVVPGRIVNIVVG